ncbi:MAG: Bax inhibitor-1 family protein, partial [Cellvibrionales bacterium]|nr:Bax inhibitor-1 family protein [Cellvibrionales bacterium]
MSRDELFQHSHSTGVEMNKVLKNTYMLLSATLIFSAIMAAISVFLAVPYMVSMVCSIASLLLVWFVLPRTANSEKGILVVFAFTGLLGFGLGPILNHYLSMQHGASIIAQALGGTGIIFFVLSTY